MYIAKEIKSLLKEKLNFTTEQIHEADENLKVSSKLIGLVHIVKSDSVNRQEKLAALNEIQVIKSQLGHSGGSIKSIVSQAYDNYYSYKNYKSSTVAFSF